MKYWFIRSPFRTRKWEDILMSGVFNLYGIRNYLAKKNISEMSAGDMALWYSNTSGKKVYGIIKVKGNAYADKTSASSWLAIDFIPVMTFNKPITLQELKENRQLATSSIIKQQRISVINLSQNEYNEIITLDV